MIGDLELNVAPFFVFLGVMVTMVVIGLSGPSDDDRKDRRSSSDRP